MNTAPARRFDDAANSIDIYFDLLSIVLDLVEAIQALQQAVQVIRLETDLPSAKRMTFDAALATSELGTKSALGEVKKIIELDSQPNKNEQ